MIVTILFTAFLAVLCFTSGSRNVLSAVFTPFLIYAALNSEYTYLALGGLVLSLISLSAFWILGWDENPKKPLFWKIIQHSASLAGCALVIIYFLIPIVITDKETIWSMIYTSVFTTAITFFAVRIFITDPIYCLINRLYTTEVSYSSKRINDVQSETGYKSIGYFIYLKDAEDGRFYINSIFAFYLNRYAKGKTVEFVLKRGCMGLLYCSSLPKTVK